MHEDVEMFVVVPSDGEGQVALFVPVALDRRAQARLAALHDRAVDDELVEAVVVVGGQLEQRLDGFVVDSIDPATNLEVLVGVGHRDHLLDHLTSHPNHILLG